MGIIPSGLGDVHLGQETAGVIRRVGSAVLDLAVGDRIFALADGCLRTRMTLPASLCVRIPHSLSFEEAATMPACFATVLHSLVNLGQLAKDQVKFDAFFKDSLQLHKILPCSQEAQRGTRLSLAHFPLANSFSDCLNTFGLWWSGSCSYSDLQSGRRTGMFACFRV